MATHSEKFRHQTAREVRNVTLVGLAVNFILSLIKFVVGWLGSSQAVLADAVHSLSDMSTDLAILFGVKYWSAPADENHPYGHGRLESLITVFIGFVLVLVAIGICWKAVLILIRGGSTPSQWIAIIGAAASIVTKEALYRWTLVVGQKTRSSALKANAWHHRSDALSSIPALIAVIISTFRPEWAFVDQIGALIVSAIIFRISGSILLTAVNDLLDRAAPAPERQRIKQLALTIPLVQDVHAVRTRRMGYGFFVDLHIQVRGEMTVEQGHDVSEEVKRILLNEGPDVLDVVVHLEPYS
ncbi:cation transporter [candidate division KSB1 bacterium]|nr:cation transporter [candidate division KSB1 bacterium]